MEADWGSGASCGALIYRLAASMSVVLCLIARCWDPG